MTSIRLTAPSVPGPVIAELGSGTGRRSLRFDDSRGVLLWPTVVCPYGAKRGDALTVTSADGTALARMAWPADSNPENHSSDVIRDLPAGQGRLTATFAGGCWSSLEVQWMGCAPGEAWLQHGCAEVDPPGSARPDVARAPASLPHLTGQPGPSPTPEVVSTSLPPGYVMPTVNPCGPLPGDWPDGYPRPTCPEIPVEASGWVHG
jgi:hypothetical protein